MSSLRTWISWAVLGAVLFPRAAHARLPAPPRFAVRSDLFRALDRAAAQGMLQPVEALYYKVAALRAPELLPAPWQRALEAAAPAPGCYTPVLVEAFQALPTLSASWQARFRNLLFPRQDYDYYVEQDEPFPFRVTFPDPSLEQGARSILAAAEQSYIKQVEEWGFWLPPLEPDMDYYRIFYEPTQMGGGGYTAPYDFVQETDWADAYTYVVIDSRNPAWFLPGTMAHEFNHTCQAAMDVLEVTAFWENTATYIMSQVFDNAWIYTESAFAAFQATPYRRLEHMLRGNSDGYEYGGGLWIVFLEALYGNEDPNWIRSVWEGSVQTRMVNEPDYFDVIHELLADQGGFGAMVRTFGEYRYFVGSRDDGQHLVGAGGWSDGTVAVEDVFDMDDLPVRGAGPIRSRRPQPNGCNYYELDVTLDTDQPIRFRFEGQEGEEWSVQVFRVRPGSETMVSAMELDATAMGTLDVETERGDLLVLAVCRIAVPPAYDPDVGSAVGADYTFDIEVLAPEPKVRAVSPERLRRGIQGVMLLVQGEDFVFGPGLSVSFGQPKVVANSVQFVSSQELRVEVVVARSAELGPTDVIVENPGGRKGVGRGLLEIVDSTGADGGLVGDGGQVEPPAAGRGCGCRSAAPTPGLVWLLGFVLLARIRRRL